MQHAEYKKHAHYGPGGRDCPCCGPAPQRRKRADRTERRKLKFRMRREVGFELQIMSQDLPA